MSFCMCGKTAETFGGLVFAVRRASIAWSRGGCVGCGLEDAYRTLVKVWHPDRFQIDLKLKIAADEKLKEINAAHDYLFAEHNERNHLPQHPNRSLTRAKRERPADVPDFVSEATEKVREPPAPSARRYFGGPSVESSHRCAGLSRRWYLCGFQQIPCFCRTLETARYLGGVKGRGLVRTSFCLDTHVDRSEGETAHCQDKRCCASTCATC